MSPTASLFNLATSLVLGAFLMSTSEGYAVAQSHNAGSAEIVHEKDLRVDPNTGYGAFAWRPDSKAIAYVKWLSGRIGVIDVDTGSERELPNFQMNGATALAWSPDGTLIALSAGSELNVVRVSDGEVVGRQMGRRDLLDPIGFHAMAFTADNKKLIIDNSGSMKFIFQGRHRLADGTVLPPPTKEGLLQLTVYDIEAKTLAPLFRMPDNEQMERIYVKADSSKFYRLGSRLYYLYVLNRPSELLVRNDEGKVIGVKIDGRVVHNQTLESLASPATCYVVDLSDPDHITQRSMDFPPPGKETADGSRDIVIADYSAPADRLVVEKRVPYNWDASPSVEIGKLTHFLEVYRFGETEPVSAFGAGDEWRDLRFYYASHPVRPWAILVAHQSSDSSDLVVLLDLETGRTIGRLRERGKLPLVSLAISPDGKRIAFKVSGYTIPIYKINNSDGGR